jgi:hypothetical protein
MKLWIRIAVTAGSLALAAAPAMALANPPSTAGQGHGNGPTYAPEPLGPKAPLPEKANAYGVYCQGQSKKHVDGQKGTPFSQCVTAMAKAADNKKLSARQACKGMSKKHVKGQRGTPFSRCVTAAAKLRRAETKSN